MVNATATFHAQDLDGSSEVNDRLIRQLAFELAVDDAIENMPKSRARRASRTCGPRLIAFVMKVCGDLCSPQEGKDIATHCCGSQCTDEYIREACCP
ncbi:hypothetical protein B9Z55_006226 [Caenorhabditis nigoni]|nr:hypothetical protein B9Z55_006226 [Caenorhabditis nigoni]